MENEIQTATGVRHEVLWCAVSPLSKNLIFDIVDQRKLSEIIAEFEEPKNTERITYYTNDQQQIFEGYTCLVTFCAKEEGTIRIHLARKTEAE